MKTARMSMRRQWRNMGVNCKRNRWDIERALTGKPGIDALIRDGFENPKAYRTEKEMERIVKDALKTQEPV